MGTELITSVLVGIFMGPALLLFVTPIFCVVRTICYIPFVRRHLREDAEKKGHVIEATLCKSCDVKEHSSEMGSIGTGKKTGVYKYQYKGKTYKTRIRTMTKLPDKLLLYYIEKPRKATVASDLGNWEIPWFKFYIIISFFISIVTTVVVMDMVRML